MSRMTRELHPLGLPRGIALPVDSRLRYVSTGRRWLMGADGKKGGERGGRGDGYGDVDRGGRSGWFAWMTDGGGQG